MCVCVCVCVTTPPQNQNLVAEVMEARQVMQELEASNIRLQDRSSVSASYVSCVGVFACIWRSELCTMDSTWCSVNAVLFKCELACS